ncbi:MAG: DUF4037 domain-containing protein [Bacteroidota bacterium]
MKLDVIQAVADRYAAFPNVRAVALGGSLATGAGGPDADADLYVYTDSPLSLDERCAVVLADARHAEVGNTFFEPGDEWTDTQGRRFDAMFRAPLWIEDQLDRVLVRHEASVGYSTCFWHNVRTSTVLFDRDGWYTALHARAQQPYPEPLRRAIVAKNHPLLRTATASFRYQLARALDRDDAVSVNHRTAALLASVFDVLFALNRTPHPGEKRLLRHAAHLPLVPAAFDAEVRTALVAPPAERLAAVDVLCDGLDTLVRTEGLGGV